jgi:hypothetical protein
MTRLRPGQPAPRGFEPRRPPTGRTPHARRPQDSSRTTNWTTTELTVAAGLVSGEVVDLTAQTDRQVRAAVVRDLLIQRWPPGMRAQEPDPRGIRLVAAEIDGRLDLDHLDTPVPLVLRGGCVPAGVTARFAHLSYLALTDLTLGTPDEPLAAFDGTGLEVDGVLSLAGTEARSATEDGTVRLSGAHVHQQLNLTEAVLTNTAGPALQADTLVADHDAALARLHATATSTAAAVRLRLAHIGGRLSITPDAVLANGAGPALDAEGLHVDGDAFLAGLTATGDGGDGAVRLAGAHLGAQLNLTEAVLTNHSGPALVADGLFVGDSAVLTGLRASADSRDAAVRLMGARISGQLNLGAVLDDRATPAPAALTNPSGPSLAADGAVVDDDLVLAGVQASGSGKSGTLRLAGTQIGGVLVGDLAAVASATSPAHRITVEGLTYRGVPGTGVTAWLDMLTHATPSYTAQPYRHLAAATAAAGHDHQTRQVLITQRRDQLTRAARRPARLWGWITWWTLGYGYQPWRALVALAAAAAAAAALTLWIGTWGLYLKDQPDQRCTPTDRVILGIDTTLPIISTPTTESCLPRTTNVSGRWITSLGVTEQMTGWALSTLFIAGFTNAVRKT